MHFSPIATSISDRAHRIVKLHLSDALFVHCHAITTSELTSRHSCIYSMHFSSIATMLDTLYGQRITVASVRCTFRTLPLAETLRYTVTMLLHLSDALFVPCHNLAGFALVWLYRLHLSDALYLCCISDGIQQRIENLGLHLCDALYSR